MKKNAFLLLVVMFLFSNFVYSETSVSTATIRVNSDIEYQKITGFGGFVNSPQFGYNHMNRSEIQRLWEKIVKWVIILCEFLFRIMKVVGPRQFQQQNWQNL